MSNFSKNSSSTNKSAKFKVVTNDFIKNHLYGWEGREHMPVGTGKHYLLKEFKVDKISVQISTHSCGNPGISHIEESEALATVFRDAWDLIPDKAKSLLASSWFRKEYDHIHLLIVDNYAAYDHHEPTVRVGRKSILLLKKGGLTMQYGQQVRLTAKQSRRELTKRLLGWIAYNVKNIAQDDLSKYVSDRMPKTFDLLRSYPKPLK